LEAKNNQKPGARGGNFQQAIAETRSSVTIAVSHRCARGEVARASAGGEVARRLCCLAPRDLLGERQWAQPPVLKLLPST